MNLSKKQLSFPLRTIFNLEQEAEEGSLILSQFLDHLTMIFSDQGWEVHQEANTCLSFSVFYHSSSATSIEPDDYSDPY